MDIKNRQRVKNHAELQHLYKIYSVLDVWVKKEMADVTFIYLCYQQNWQSSMETREKVLSSEQNNKGKETEEANADAAQPPVRTGAVISGSKKVRKDKIVSKMLSCNCDRF